MSKDTSLLPDALRSLSTTFAGEPTVSGEKITLEEVHRFLREKIALLFNRNPGMLMSILYRIDVSESKLKRAMAETGPELLPAVIADLVIERQLQKLRVRREYYN